MPERAKFNISFTHFWRAKNERFRGASNLVWQWNPLAPLANLFDTPIYMFVSLKTSIWAPALLRRAVGAGAYAAIIKKGDLDAGSALIKVRTLDDFARLYEPMRDMDGARVWREGERSDEAEIDKHIEKRLSTDPDLWIIEIEDRQGRHFLLDQVEFQQKAGKKGGI